VRGDRESLSTTTVMPEDYVLAPSRTF
jgi:hypothetical protein